MYLERNRSRSQDYGKGERKEGGRLVKKTFELYLDKTENEYIQDLGEKNQQSEDRTFAGVRLCAGILKKFFDIPDGTNKIWVNFSDEPMENAYFTEDHSLAHRIVRLLDGDYEVIMFYRRTCDEFYGYPWINIEIEHENSHAD
jgi:hypothetical protein